MNHLAVCRVPPAGRLTLFDTRLTQRDARGRGVAEREIADAGDLRDCLRDRFGIELDGIDVPAMFTRLGAA